VAHHGGGSVGVSEILLIGLMLLGGIAAMMVLIILFYERDVYQACGRATGGPPAGPRHNTVQGPCYGEESKAEGSRCQRH